MPAEPKRHHYVPKMILKRFRSASGKLYYFNKKRPEKGIEPRNLDKIFCDRHIYSSVMPDGSKKAILERFFSRMESDADSFFHEMEEIVSANRVPSLSAVQKKFLIDFLYRQWKRVPDRYEKYAPFEKFDEIMIEVLGEKFEGEELESKLQLIAELSDEQVRRIYNNAKIDALAAGFIDLEKILMPRKLVFLKPAEADRFYIIGSQSIIRETYGNTGRLDDKTDIVMPISKSLLIGFGHRSGNDELIFHDRKLVRAVNQFIANQSNEIAGTSERQLRSLLNPR